MKDIGGRGLNCVAFCPEANYYHFKLIPKCLKFSNEEELFTLTFLWLIMNSFDQYQQNEQSPLILTELTEHNKTTTNDIRNPSPVLGQTQYFTCPLSYLLTVEV